MWLFIVQLHKFRKFVSQKEEDGVVFKNMAALLFCAVLRFSHRRRKQQTCDEDFRTDAMRQALLHHFKASKGTKSFSKLSDWKENRTEQNRTEKNAPSPFPFLSFAFFLFSLDLALEAYREKSCRVVLIATKWAVSGGSLWAPPASVFLTVRVGVGGGYSRWPSHSKCRGPVLLVSCSHSSGYHYFRSYFRFSVSSVF